MQSEGGCERQRITGPFPINHKTMEMQIDIIVSNKDGEVVAKRTAYDFSGAMEDLGKLERFVEKEGLKVLDEMENRESPDEEAERLRIDTANEIR